MAEDLQEKALEAQVNRAKGEGWVPLDEWEGDPGDWVDYREFNLRGELMKRIKKQSSDLVRLRSENESLNQTLKDLAEHNKKIAQAEKEKVLRELRQARNQARRDEDFELQDELEDKIDEVKSMEVEEPAKSESQDPNQLTSAEQAIVKEEFQNFIKRNPWYVQDEDARAQADEVGAALLNSNPLYRQDFALFYADVEKEMKNKLPANKRGVTAPDVTESSSNRGSDNNSSKSKPKKYTVRDLNEEQRAISKRLVSSGAFESEQEYVDQLAELGEINA